MVSEKETSLRCFRKGFEVEEWDRNREESISLHSVFPVPSFACLRHCEVTFAWSHSDSYFYAMHFWYCTTRSRIVKVFAVLIALNVSIVFSMNEALEGVVMAFCCAWREKQPLQ